MIGQLQDAGNTTTLSHYLDMLNTAGLLAGIEKFSGNLIYKRSPSPKFQVHNTPLISAQSGSLFKNILIKPDDWGRLVESSIGAHLINYSIVEGFTVSYRKSKAERPNPLPEYQPLRKHSIPIRFIGWGQRSALAGLPEIEPG